MHTLVIMAFSFLALGFEPQPGPTFLVDPRSVLEIHGTSNVNTFICTCRQAFSPSPYQLETEPVNGALNWTFNQATLHLQTTMFDCGNKVMNKDFYNALKARTHPEIRIDLQGLDRVPGITTAWATMTTRTAITIAGVRKPVPIQATIRKLGPNTYQVRASKLLRMSDFNIAPPTALMGMIKTRDEITIRMDLILHLG